MRKDQEKDREYRKAYNANEVAIRRAAGLCEKCGKHSKVTKALCGTCQDRHQRNTKAASVARRANVMAYYGGQCACCGEREPLFLTIDHKGGGGEQHRRAIKRRDITRWIVENNYPAEFQVLCWSCNCGRQLNGGVCPHQEVKRA